MLTSFMQDHARTECLDIESYSRWNLPGLGEMVLLAVELLEAKYSMFLEIPSSIHELVLYDTK